ncbi:MAG: hypothetical protein KDK91_19830 [Gammaproteobacteria bacterium]|nr:hypothetical protein [Gammaproteobacteria bacterium]
MLAAPAAFAAGDIGTRFTNQGGITNTRHNLTQAPLGGGAVLMDPHRNDYEEVCVYCHTPHGANPNVAAPLWNRTASGATYTTYDQLGTSSLTQPVSTPGVNSLTCLSCHDGTLGIDSIINMPNRNGAGVPSGNFSTSQYSAPQDNAFLDTWRNLSGNNATHVTLGDSENTVGCMVCHSEGSSFSNAVDFDVFVIGTDLRNDHPVGVRFPDAPGSDFNPTTGDIPGVAFFDLDGDNRPDNDEIRLYDTGEGPEVECASCHDPHGVPSAGPGSTHLPAFLRVANIGSGVCLTCHTK